MITGRVVFIYVSTLVLLTTEAQAQQRRGQPVPTDDKSRTVSYTAYFSGVELLDEGETLDSSKVNSTKYDVLVADNTQASMYITLLKQGQFLTTVLTPSIGSLTAKTVLPGPARSLDFDVNLTLRPPAPAKPVNVGARALLSGLTQQYYYYNPTLTLRWPVTWSTLSSYADSDGNLVFDAVIVIRDPAPAKRVTTPSPNMQQPIEQRPIVQRPYDPFEQRPADLTFPGRK